MNENAAFGQLPLALEGTGYHADGTQFSPENEAMGFFGNLLDQAYNPCMVSMLAGNNILRWNVTLSPISVSYSPSRPDTLCE